MTDTSSPKSPCFLLGAPRSGTTWLQRLLQAHPRICGGEESHFFTLFGSTLEQADVWAGGDRRGVGPLVYMDRAEYEALFRDMWGKMFARLYAEHPEAMLHLEKSPEHTLCLSQIVRIFPDAKFIFLLRDSRSVTASLLHAQASWGKNWAPTGPREAAALWRRYVKVARRWQAKHPEHPFLMLRYEDLMQDPKANLAKVLAFLLPDEVDPDVDTTLARFEAQKKNQTDPEGFSRIRGADAWRQDLSPWQKLVVWRETRHLLRELGYDTHAF